MTLKTLRDSFLRLPRTSRFAFVAALLAMVAIGATPTAAGNICTDQALLAMEKADEEYEICRASVFMSFFACNAAWIAKRIVIQADLESCYLLGYSVP